MPLTNKIKNIIQETGNITIAEYMSLALYDNEYGYYRKKDPLGVKGDFITAPEISQIFGELIGIWLITQWQSAGSPEKFILAELGPGRGTLMKDILRVASKVPEFINAAEIHLVEINEPLKEEQKKSLSTYRSSPTWHDSFDNIPDGPLFLIANEFFDALPIHQYKKCNDNWREVVVTASSSPESHSDYRGVSSDRIEIALKFSEADLSNDEEIDFPENSKEGDVFEICPAGIEIARNIAERINQHSGAALIIDYGYESVINNSESGSLQAVQDHKYHDPLVNPGEADLTAHVNFSHLMNAAERTDAKTFGTVKQGDFLINMGIELRAAMLCKNLDEENRKTFLSGVKRLTSPDEMGTLFKCMTIVDKNANKPVGF